MRQVSCPTHDQAIERFTPNSEQRLEAVKHVVYEYANWTVAAYYSLSGSAPWRTCCDDAFLIGCRKLYDFLMKDNRSRKNGCELDDILATDYARPRTWSLPQWGAEWNAPMNKQLAHITYSRNKEWDHQVWVPKLRLEFKIAWDMFRGQVEGIHALEFDKQLKLCRDKPGFDMIKI